MGSLSRSSLCDEKLVLQRTPEKRVPRNRAEAGRRSSLLKLLQQESLEKRIERNTLMKRRTRLRSEAEWLDARHEAEESELSATSDTTKFSNISLM